MISFWMFLKNKNIITVYLPRAVWSTNDSGGVGNNTELLSSDKEFDVFSFSRLTNCASYQNKQQNKTNTLENGSVWNDK